MSLTLNALRKLQQAGAFPSQEESAQGPPAPTSDPPAEQRDTADARSGNVSDPPPKNSKGGEHQKPEEGEQNLAPNTITPARLEQEPPLSTETEHTLSDPLPGDDPLEAEDDQKHPAAESFAIESLPRPKKPTKPTTVFTTEPVDHDALKDAAIQAPSRWTRAADPTGKPDPISSTRPRDPKPVDRSRHNPPPIPHRDQAPPSDQAPPKTTPPDPVTPQDAVPPQDILPPQDIEPRRNSVPDAQPQESKAATTLGESKLPDAKDRLSLDKKPVPDEPAEPGGDSQDSSVPEDPTKTKAPSPLSRSGQVDTQQLTPKTTPPKPVDGPPTVALSPQGPGLLAKEQPSADTSGESVPERRLASLTKPLTRSKSNPLGLDTTNVAEPQADAKRSSETPDFAKTIFLEDEEPSGERESWSNDNLNKARPRDKSQPTFSTLEATNELLSSDPVGDLNTAALDGLAVQPAVDDSSSRDKVSDRPAVDLGKSLSLDAESSLTSEKRPSSDSPDSEARVGDNQSDLAGSRGEASFAKDTKAVDAEPKPSKFGSRGSDKRDAPSSSSTSGSTFVQPIKVDLKRHPAVTAQTYREFYDPIIPTLDDLGDAANGEAAAANSQKQDEAIVAELVDADGGPTADRKSSFQVQSQTGEEVITAGSENSGGIGVIPTGYENELIQKLEDPTCLKQFTELRDQLDARGGQSPGKFLLLSPTPTERTADVTAHLAVMFDREQREVLIVDGNLEQQTLTRRFEAQNQCGLCDAFTQHQRPSDVVLPTSFNHVRFVPAGDDVTGISRVPDQVPPADIRQILREWTRSPRTIFCDVGPMNAALALPMAEAFDGVMMVVTMKDLSLDRVREASSQLKSRGINVLGCVITDA